MIEITISYEDAKEHIGRKMGRCLHPMDPMPQLSPYKDAIKAAYSDIHDMNNEGWPDGFLPAIDRFEKLVETLRAGYCPDVFINNVVKQAGHLMTDITGDQDEVAAADSFGNR